MVTFVVVLLLQTKGLLSSAMVSKGSEEQFQPTLQIRFHHSSPGI
jgi:hypothetical protein